MLHLALYVFGFIGKENDLFFFEIIESRACFLRAPNTMNSTTFLIKTLDCKFSLESMLS